MRRTSRAALAAATLFAGLLTAPGLAQADDPAGFTLRPGANQLYVLDATPGTALDLVHDGAVVQSGTVDAAGSLVWREVDAGEYSVAGSNVTVPDFDDPAPPQSFYDGQSLDEGFNYIAARDGTTLSANVWFPPGEGPFPTVVEYSGYSPSDPGETTFAQLYNALGFAYVGVNIRGTGCSGGSFLNFEPIQSLDGYDVIETVAAQPWAKYHEVGMVGISYPGITQLYVARTQPPHLSAITPLSVIDDTYRSTLYPGGVLNTGFAVPWAKERAEQSAPFGQGWEQGRVDAGDTTCAANQEVRLQNPDPLALVTDNPFYGARYYDMVNPTLFADRIDVPVFLAAAWQDEQTGGHSPEILDELTGSPHVYASLVNGSHTESLSLGILGRYADFLDLYVARRVPAPNDAFPRSFIATTLAKSLTGVDGLAMPPGPSYAGMTFEQALASFESRDPIQVLFEEGAADGQPSGSPLPRFVESFPAWPVPSAKATAWYLGGRGELRGRPLTQAAKDLSARSYRARPKALPATTYSGSNSGIWQAHPEYDWRQIPARTGLGWISRPLKKDTVAVGTGSVDLWIRSNADDTDLEVTLSEVRPNGTEIYVQSGWLRAGHRALDLDESTPIRPVHTDLEADYRPLPADTFTKVRVELFPFAQPFRKGSRLRITVDAPGGARPLWDFDTTIAGGERVWIATDRTHRSRLVLPVVPGVDVPRKAPPCASLRSQPCRKFPG